MSPFVDEELHNRVVPVLGSQMQSDGSGCIYRVHIGASIHNQQLNHVPMSI
jgi:hypothetical protein